MCIQALLNPQLVKGVLPNFAAKILVVHAVNTSSICYKSEKVYVQMTVFFPYVLFKNTWAGFYFLLILSEKREPA